MISVSILNVIIPLNFYHKVLLLLLFYRQMFSGKFSVEPQVYYSNQHLSGGQVISFLFLPDIFFIFAEIWVS